jgi:hypothetical protein
MPVSDRDKGFRALFGRLAGAKGLSLTVGIHGPEGSEPAAGGGELTVTQIGIVHEYGLGNAYKKKPGGRSFIRAWADENKEQNLATLAKIAQAVVQGKFDARTGLDRAGLLFVAQVQKRIKAGIPPALDEKTIAAKGSATPLIDTGQLWSSIRHKVSTEGEQK